MYLTLGKDSKYQHEVLEAGHVEEEITTYQFNDFFEFQHNYINNFVLFCSVQINFSNRINSKQDIFLLGFYAPRSPRESTFLNTEATYISSGFLKLLQKIISDLSTVICMDESCRETNTANVAHHCNYSRLFFIHIVLVNEGKYGSASHPSMSGLKGYYMYLDT